MGGSIRPEPDLDSLIAARRKALAGEPDLDSLIAARRKALAIPAAPRDATAAGPRQPDALSTRVLRNLGTAVTQIVTHPIETAETAVTAPLKSFADAVLSPSVGEARHNPNLSKGGNSAGLTASQIAQPYDAEHGAVTGKQRAAAAAQTVANVAFPSIANTVAGRATSAGVPGLLSKLLGTSVAGGAAGAAYSPDDPAAGFFTGAILTPALAGTAKAVSGATGRSITALGLRPTGRSAVEIAADAARMREPMGAEAGAATPVTETSAGTRAPRAPDGVSPAPTLVDRARAAAGKVATSSGVESSKTLALRELARRMQLDNVSPADALALARNNPTKPVAVLDLGEGNVAGLARTAKDVPSLARRDIPRFLNDRSRGVRGAEGMTLQRLTQDFERRIGLKPENYFQTADEMLAEQQKLSKPAYDKVRGVTVDDPEVLSLFDIPEFQQVHNAVARAERIRPGGQKIAPLSEETTLPTGEVSRVQNPQTLGTLDKMRSYLYQVARGKLDGGPIDRYTASAMMERLDAATQRLDELHPEYADARAGFAGRARGMDAFEAGRDEFMKLDPREIQRNLAKMSESEASLYRRGAYDALRGKLLKMDDGANIGQFLERNPDIRARVEALARSAEEASAMRDDLGVERAMGERKNQILSGPNTAERLIEHWSTVPMVTQVGNIARKVPLVGNLGGGAIDNLLTRRFSQQTGDVMGEVGKLMTRNGPEQIALTFDDIRKLLEADNARALRRTRSAATIGATNQQNRQ